MRTQKLIRVVIADRHTMFRRGLAKSIEGHPDLELVGEAGRAGELTALCSHLHPDVVLVDITLLEMDIEQVIRIIHRHTPKTRVLVLTGIIRAGVVKMVFSAGAIGYLLKNITQDDLIRAIRDAYKGKATLSGEAEQALVHAIQRPVLSPHILTGREREVLSLMVRGFTNAQIAEHLTISIFTVKKHISSIFAKLETTNRRQAVAMAVQHKLVVDWSAPV